MRIGTFYCPPLPTFDLRCIPEDQVERIKWLVRLRMPAIFAEIECYRTRPIIQKPSYRNPEDARKRRLSIGRN